MKLNILNSLLLLFVYSFVYSSCSNSESNSDYIIQDNDPECHQKLPDFGKVEIFGSFADDLGCEYTSMKIKNKVYDYSKGVEILAKKYVKSKNEKKLITLIDELYLQHQFVVITPDQGFLEENKEFTAMELFKTDSDYVLTCWVKTPAQMVPVVTYQYVEFRINSEGIIKQIVTDGFKHQL